MLGGELHYWRVQPRFWNRALRAAKRLGLDTVGTYVPWNVHELEEGRYDFELLIAFLRAVEAHGLGVFIRPGPYICAEWRNLGLPDHALPYHRLHPAFLAKAGEWIRAVMHAIRPFLGSPIVLLQADNEIDPLLFAYGEDQGFSAWLRRRYARIEDLNASWGTKYASFEEAAPWFIPADSPQARDSAAYRYDLATAYARWVVDAYRRCGCTVPIVLNTWPGVDAQHWRDLAAIADSFGIDPYPSNECRHDLRVTLERMRLLRLVTRQPLLTELGCGIWEGVRRRYRPDHYRLLAMMALMVGVRGWNWYMLVARDRWSGAALDRRGRARRALAKVLQECSEAFRELEGAPAPEVSCALTWSWRHEQMAQTLRIARGVKDDAQVDGLRLALFELGVEYDFVDVDQEIPPYPIVFHAGGLDDPRHLWRYVERGGNLVLFQDLIHGCARPAGTSHPYARDLEVSVGFSTDRAVFTYREVPGVPIVARQERGDAPPWLEGHASLALGRTYTVGYHERRGAGSLTVLGCWPSREAILALHRFLGVALPVVPLTRTIHASLRGSSLVVVNPGEATRATLEAAGTVVSLEMPRCSGAIVKVGAQGA